MHVFRSIHLSLHQVEGTYHAEKLKHEQSVARGEVALAATQAATVRQHSVVIACSDIQVPDIWSVNAE